MSRFPLCSDNAVCSWCTVYGGGGEVFLSRDQRYMTSPVNGMAFKSSRLTESSIMSDKCAHVIQADTKTTGPLLLNVILASALSYRCVPLSSDYGMSVTEKYYPKRIFFLFFNSSKSEPYQICSEHHVTH